MLFEEDRKRRVIYNDDSDQQFRDCGKYKITDEQGKTTNPVIVHKILISVAY